MYNLNKLIEDIADNTEFKGKVFDLEPFSIETSHSSRTSLYDRSNTIRFRSAISFNLDYVVDGPESFRSDKEDAAKRLLRHTYGPCFALIDELENYICNRQLKEARNLIKEFKEYFT